MVIQLFILIKVLPVCKTDAVGGSKLSPRVVLGERCKIIPSVHENADRLKPKRGKRTLQLFFFFFGKEEK